MDQKRLKIAFLSRYVGTVDRGVETYVLELSKILKKDYEVDVLTNKDADSLLKIIKGRYDILIATNGRMQSLKASFGRLFSNYKLIISGQAGMGRDDIWNLVFAIPSVYVALTDFESNWAKKWAWRSKVAKIPNGVDLGKFTPSGEKIKLGSKPVVLSVGALYWYKHHELTIKAISKLEKIDLIIVGSGPEKQELMQMGNKLLGKDRFKILDVSFDDIPKYYRSSDVFTLPSWDREAFGIVYVEAMASGLPVVAPDDLSRKEIIGDAGVFTNVYNEQSYASAIEYALKVDWEDIPRKQAEKFSWEKIASRYSMLFREIIK